MSSPCAAPTHKASHRGRLVIGGSASAGFTFHHADRAPYGSAIKPAAVDVSAEAFGALRHLGFKETKVRKLIACVQAAGAPHSLEEFLRAALREV